MLLELFSDGGSRGNPGKSAAAFVAIIDGKFLYQRGEFLQMATNNEAEYSGLKLGIEWLLASEKLLRENAIDKVLFKTDSLLMASQIQRQWKIKEPRMKQYAEVCWQLLNQLKQPYEIRHIPREENTRADALVNKILDEAG